jgi:hypothetical protein
MSGFTLVKSLLFYIKFANFKALNYTKMQISAISIDEYISKIPEERKVVFKKIFDAVNNNLPKGFSENISYGMVGWAVPLETYPPGYHCTPGTPLPFINLASQKNFIALYHMGIYAKPELLNWFVEEFPKHSKRKLDMGNLVSALKKLMIFPLSLLLS